MSKKIKEQIVNTLGISNVLTDFSSVVIGKKYARMDEIGVRFCITIDHQTLKDGSFTLRDRDNRNQIRSKDVGFLIEFISKMT